MVAAVRLRGLETDLELLQKPDQMHLLIRRQWEVPREVRTRHPEERKEELPFPGDTLIHLDAADTALKTCSLPSQAKRQEAYVQTMSGSAFGAIIGAGLGMLLLGLPGLGIGAMVGGQMTQASSQASAMKAQREKVESAYREILEEARDLLLRVQRDVGKSVKKATLQFEADWVDGARAAQWQVIEMAGLAGQGTGQAKVQLDRRRKTIACAIQEFQIAAASLMSNP